MTVAAGEQRWGESVAAIGGGLDEVRLLPRRTGAKWAVPDPVQARDMPRATAGEVDLVFSAALRAHQEERRAAMGDHAYGRRIEHVARSLAALRADLQD